MGTAPPPSTSGSPFGLIIAFLVSAGPVILVLSIVAMALALASRRWVAMIPVLVGGLVLFWGMYTQAERVVMYAAIAVGMLIWVAAFAWRIRPVKVATRLESR